MLDWLLDKGDRTSATTSAIDYHYTNSHRHFFSPHLLNTLTTPEQFKWFIVLSVSVCHLARRAVLFGFPNLNFCALRARFDWIKSTSKVKPHLGQTGPHCMPDHIATPPGWDASPSQITPSILSQVPIFTPGWRDALWELRVSKNTAQWPRPALKPGPLDPELTERANHWASASLKEYTSLKY